VLLALVMSFPAMASKPTVWVVDGAGASLGCSTHFHAANRRAGAPFAVRVFPWHHDSKRIGPDQRDGEHAARMGRNLAAEILKDGASQPRLLAFSAGAAVALAAAEHLPKHHLFKLSLLAPSVSSRYPLGHAVLATEFGIDVFISEKDIWVQGVAGRLFGAADHLGGPGAGRRGFQTVPANVRQHAWQPSWKMWNHDGGHFGAHEPAFLEKVVFPSLRD
jgi:hypothetical protein